MHRQDAAANKAKEIATDLYDVESEASEEETGS